MPFRKTIQKIIKPTFLFLFCLLLGNCDIGSGDYSGASEMIQADSTEQILGKGYDFVNNGKISREKFTEVLTPAALDSFDLPVVTKELAEGLRQQLKLLKYEKKLPNNFSGLSLTKAQLKKTIDVLLSAQFNNSFGILKDLEAHQIWGEDQKGNVHFTGYFTPILKVRKKPNSIYKYPIYRYPKGWEGKLPTREEIEHYGFLKNMDLEIAYAKSKLDIYFMQVQGSGYIQFPNGSRKLLAHGGSNKHSYRSIGRFMVNNGYATPENVSLKSIKKYFQRNPHRMDSILYINPSYVFFTPVNTQPRGAGHVPLTPEYSVAIDRKVLPLGSCLLASVPVLDERRNFSHHEFRILLAQDIGGAIKGTGHVDLYRGVGLSAERKASALHHYGNIWLLLPKESLEE